MTKPRPVRLALLGAGAIMRLSHAPTIRRSTDSELAEFVRLEAVRALVAWYSAEWPESVS